MPASAFSLEEKPVNPFQDIYEQYVDEAAFLWLLRSIAVDQPHYNVMDLHMLEQRIEANLDGLMTSPEDAWDICEQTLDIEEPGEVFTAAVVAFRSLESNKIQKAVEMGLASHNTAKALISSLGWLPGKLCHPWIKKFLASKDLNHKYLAIASCSVRRENPGEYLNKILQREDCRQHEKLYARALRLIGELKHHDLMPVLNAAMDEDNMEIAFWANWSALLLGNKAVLNQLRPYIFTPGVNQQRAIQLVFRILSVEDARQWISQLAEDENQVRNVIKATGILGDPHAVNWLIGKMQQPTLARLAGEAFTFITGIDLEQRQLANELPDLTEQIPNDDPDDDHVAMDEDENLPWPNVEKIASTWQQYGSRFKAGQRYFMGRPIEPNVLSQQLAEGYQRHRHAAALELALLDAQRPLANVKARRSQ